MRAELAFANEIRQSHTQVDSKVASGASGKTCLNVPVRFHLDEHIPEGEAHAGIAYCRQGSMSLGLMLRKLVLFTTFCLPRRWWVRLNLSSLVCRKISASRIARGFTTRLN
jgi:hypothetical protein